MSIFMKTMAAKNPIAALRKEGEIMEASASAAPTGGGDWDKCKGFMWNNRCYPTRQARRQAKKAYRQRNKK